MLLVIASAAVDSSCMVLNSRKLTFITFFNSNDERTHACLHACVCLMDTRAYIRSLPPLAWPNKVDTKCGRVSQMTMSSNKSATDSQNHPPSVDELALAVRVATR